MSFMRKIKRGNLFCLTEVKNAQVDGKFLQKRPRNLGEGVDNKPFLTGAAQLGNVDKVAIFGQPLFLNKIAKKFDLEV